MDGKEDEKIESWKKIILEVSLLERVGLSLFDEFLYFYFKHLKIVLFRLKWIYFLKRAEY